MLHRRQLHILKPDGTVFQHGFYHRVLADFAGEYLLAQLVENHALQHALEGPGAELRVEALLAEVVEHLVGGFEGDADFVQALLNLLELAVPQTAPFFEDVALTCCIISFLTAMTPATEPQSTKLNGLQISLLRLFDRGMSDEEVLELRRVLVAHMSQKLLTEVERVNEERGYTAADVEEMLNDPS